MKVKRLFFWFADRHDHPWHKKLNPDDFELGRAVLQCFVSRIDMHRDRVDIFCSRQGLRHWLGGRDGAASGDAGVKRPGPSNDLLRFTVPVRLKRRGVEKKLIIQSGGHTPQSRPDPILIKAVARAHAWNRMLVSGDAKSIRGLAADHGVTHRYVRKILPLAFLAPDIIEAMVEGRQPRDLSLESLVRIPLPPDWRKQRKLLGFPSI